MKTHRLYFLLLLVFQSFVASAQEISARILDEKTGEPIPYATIVYAEEKGVITNEEGRFSLISEEPLEKLSISSMGYETYELDVAAIQPDIFLKPLSIQLQEVFITDKNLSGKEIIQKVKENLASNYNFDLSQKRFFFRQSDVNTVNRFGLEVDESTIEGIDQDLLNEISSNIPKLTGSYKEVLGDFYGNYEQQKLQITKAANLHNPSSSEKLDELTDELERLFRENLKEHSYLKIRSGIVGVKVDADELEDDIVAKETAVEKTQEELDKELVEKKQRLLEKVNSEVQQLLGTMFWKEDISLNLFEKTRKYRFEVEGFTRLDNEIVYIINFKPKGGADFRGTIYVNAQDYGVHRLDYENVKPLSRFRLLGISTAKDVYGGKMIFIGEEQGKYQPSYIEQKRGESFGLKRPLTIIEKNKVVPGRNKQNELDLDLDLSFSQVSTYQFVIYESSPLDQNAFGAFQETKEFELATFTSYNPDYWTGSNIIEPNTAIQKFTALEGK